MKNKVLKVFQMSQILYLLVIAVITFCMVEVLNDSMGLFNNKSANLIFVPIDIVIFYFAYMVLCFLFGNIKTTVCFGLSLFNLLAMVNHYVCIFRGTAFRCTDITSVGTAANVFSMYKITVDKAVVIWAIIMVITIIICKAYFKLNSNIKEKVQGRNRIVLLAIYIIILVFLIKFDYTKLGVNSFDGWKSGGYITYFVESLSQTYIKKPEGYVSGEYKDIGKVKTDNINKKPDIIVIMNESFCDVNRNFHNIKTDKEISPFFDSIISGDNVIEGNAYVSVYGGNTANTEMEFLTGSSLGFWGTDLVCYSYGYSEKINVIPKWMNDISYDTYAIHPGKDTNYGRRSVYDFMQFKSSIFLDDMLKDNVKAVNYKKAIYFLEDIINDSEDYKYVEKILNSNDRPKFIFNTTIQNHGGYGWRNIDNIKILNDIKSDDNYKQINEYITLVNQSDEALKNFIEKIKKTDRETMVLFFGDHQPTVTDLLNKELNTNLETKDFYTVPFFIWANYPIETKHNVTTSINYLQNMLLKASGMGLINDYQRHIENVEEKYPVLTPIYSEDKNGNQVDFYKVLKEDEAVNKYYKEAYKLIYDSGESN